MHPRATPSSSRSQVSPYRSRSIFAEMAGSIEFATFLLRAARNSTQGLCWESWGFYVQYLPFVGDWFVRVKVEQNMSRGTSQPQWA